MKDHPPSPSVNLRPSLRTLEPSPVLAASETTDILRAQGTPVAKLALSQSPFPVPESLVQALRQAAPIKSYAPVQGLLPLREKIAAYLKRRFQVERSPEDVLIGPGSKELCFLLSLAHEGPLIVPTPCWSSIIPQARILHKPLFLIHTTREDQFMLRPDTLSNTLCSTDLRGAILYLNSPSNPCGLTYSKEELEAFAELARAHDLLILSDESYAELHHKGQHLSIAPFCPERTLVLTGLSKWVGAGGWRLGYLSIPPDLHPLRRAMVALASQTFTATSTPIQWAAISAFEESAEIENYLMNVRRVLSALGRLVARRIQAHGATCPQPHGGLHVFIDWSAFPRTLPFSTGQALCSHLLHKARIALSPGIAFGRPTQELSARLSYVDFDGTRALSAVQVIPREQPIDETFLRRHCGPTLEALDRLLDWMRELQGE